MRHDHMRRNSISTNDLARLEEMLVDVVQRIGSIKEFEDWLRSRSFVEFIKTNDYLIKTEPPKKELLVVFKVDDGSRVKKVIDVTLYPDGSIKFAGLHDT